jgi:hypothetical protein
LAFRERNSFGRCAYILWVASVVQSCWLDQQESAILLSSFYRLRRVVVFLAIVGFCCNSLMADPIPVRSSQGTFHGFLVLKTLEGNTLAVGDIVQIAHGDRVTSRLTFHFRDGSIDDETTVFAQRKVFRLISDHHIQRGPSFPKPLDMTVDAVLGQVTSVNKDGKTVQEHFDLEPDVCNGLPLILLLNLDPAAPPSKLAMVAPTAKPRLVHVLLAGEGEDPVTIGGVRHKATNFRIKIELGGVTGVVAPIVGKQPSDIHVWILGGPAPAFVKEEGQFYEGGPIWRIELASPVFPASADGK